MLDPEVMEFAASLPVGRKVHLGRKKWALRRAYRGRVPNSILNGAKKGFGVPLGSWFRNELRAFTREILLDPRTLDRGYVRPSSLKSLLDAHDSGGGDRSFQIWALLMLELWHRDLADGARRPTRVTTASASGDATVCSP
jgi:asparagine synthase (glutamine-hydrolysing)